MWSVYKNHAKALNVFIEYKANVNMIDEEDGLTPLIVAAGRGFDEIVQRLLQAGAQVP